MKRFGRWIARVFGTVLALLLTIVLLPYASQLADTLLPDLSQRALNASVTLSRQMQQKARLETLLVKEEGVMTSSTDALLIGTVQQVSVHYAYQASIGIDLQKVEMTPQGNQLILTLPDPEVLTDSITPLSIERKDFWYPLTDKQLQKLMEDERIHRRNACLEEYAQSEDSWMQICQTMDTTIGQWLGSGENGLKIMYQRSPSSLTTQTK